MLPASPGKCSCRCLALLASEKDLCALTFPSLTFPSLALTFTGLTLSALYTSSTPPDPRLRNICPVLATSVVRRVSKRASWRTYKDNVSGIKLGCRAIEKRQSEPESQDQMIRTEYPGLDGWKNPDGLSYESLRA